MTITHPFPDINSLQLICKLAQLDMQSFDTAPQAAVARLKEFTAPIASQFNLVASAIGQLVSVRPTFFLTSKSEGDKLKDMNYLNFTSLPAQVPEGLSCFINDYIIILVKATQFNNAAVNEYLDNFIEFLSDVTTNKTSIASVTKYATTLKVEEVGREKLNAAMGKCFQHGSHDTTSVFGKVYANKADYLTAVEQTAKLNEWVGIIKPKTMQDRVIRVCELLQRIIDQVDRGEIENVSKTNLQQLSFCAYEIARNIEFFAILVYRIQAVSASMNINALKLSKAIGK